jgi:hypothetical protein
MERWKYGWFFNNGVVDDLKMLIIKIYWIVW